MSKKNTWKNEPKMTPKWAPNGSPNWPKSLKNCCGKLPVRVLTHPFQKVSQNKAKLTPWDLKKWAPVQARAQFSVLQGIPKMTKNDPQNEPRELLLGPFWHQNVTELLQNWTPKKQSKNDTKKITKMWQIWTTLSPGNRLFWVMYGTWAPLGPQKLKN